MENAGNAADILPNLSGPLLAWYDREARDLPWRKNPTPYRVWVSEIMLQQTRVEAVLGYYERFLAALPTVADLATVSEDTLLKLWEGLGYYSRARNLQKAAKLVTDKYDGQLPASWEELRKLPGIGDYTAGAIASIAFGIPAPAVDGNVCRVLSRILASRADTSRPAVKAAFREDALSMLPPGRPGDFNQSLMELGATVCLPNAAPLCGRCPVAKFCAAHQLGIETELPVKAEKKPRRVEERTVVLVMAGENLLLFRRGEGGLLAGMFEPLNLTGHLSPDAATQEIRNLGGAPESIEPLPDTKHLFSHIEWRMRCYRITCAPFDPPGGLWASREQLTGDYALPSAFRVHLATGSLPPAAKGDF